MNNLPSMYTEYAGWFHLLSAPADYAEEAALFHEVFQKACPRAQTMLELGSGAGCNAFYLKRHYQMTLVDLAPGMLALSKKLNPDLEHLEGDMRSVRLGRQFDLVFIHDAIVYMTTLADLRLAMQSAYTHLKPGGAALFVPDFTRETYHPETSHGGHDEQGRGLRYLEWQYDLDPDDTTYNCDFAFIFHEADGSVQVAGDRHIFGLFSRADWLGLLAEVGFQASANPLEHSELPHGQWLGFLGIKPES